MDAELLFWITLIAILVLLRAISRILNLTAVIHQLTSSVDDVDTWMEYYHKNRRYNRV